MSQTPSENALERIHGEEQTLDDVLSSLAAQQRRYQEKYSHEHGRARELTSALVATRRDEDKALLASDEAVSHGIKDKIETGLNHLEKLLKKPYFARLIVKEESPQGSRTIEYKMGLIENSDCRIVDWRKAPIARLYYEYREGDDYCEQILGRERQGRVALRHVVDIENQRLKGISCQLGRFEKHGDQWVALSEPQRSRSQSESQSSSFGLPQIASLLTPDQFSLVAETADSAMLIQGIAGSGKTTVAMHRLAWLLGRSQEESLVPERCLMVVLSESLKKYLSDTLPSLGVHGVRVLTLENWHAENLAASLPQYVERDEEQAKVRRPSDKCPHSIERLKRSMAILKALESNYERLGTSLVDALIELLAHPKLIVQHDESRLLDASLIQEAHARALRNKAESALDRADDALVLRLMQLRAHSVVLYDGSFGLYDHVIADEVQDFSPIDLACVLAAVRDPRGISLVGDTAQKMDASSTFPGWDTLRKHWAFKDTMPHFVSLNLSHRSTDQIVRFADFIKEGRSSNIKDPMQGGRQGRVPIWFKATSEPLALKSAIDWLSRATERYPNSFTAVVCRTAADASYVYKLLLPTFSSQLQRGVANVFSSPCGVVVTWMDEIRGLEFTNVLLWNPCKRDYPQDETHRNMLYTAVTRAEENVCLVTFLKPSEILPQFHSPLVRGHLVEPPEESDQ